MAKTSDYKIIGVNTAHVLCFPAPASIHVIIGKDNIEGIEPAFDDCNSLVGYAVKSKQHEFFIPLSTVSHVHWAKNTPPKK